MNDFDSSIWLEMIGAVLLFCLVVGMSATVEVNSIRNQLQNSRAILIGLFSQYVILPLIGFLVVKHFQLNHPTGITLLVVTSSPGGSYSNWWCSMFNADLALSVAMTSISSILSTVFLPINLAIYARLSYNDDILDTLNWSSLMLALLVVITAIVTGLLASAYYRGSPGFHVHANIVGNVAGILLVIFSAVMSTTNEDALIWNREWQFYAGTAVPCLSGLLLANLMAHFMGLIPPERVTVSIECCYQNVGIATSVALGMFEGQQLAQAVAVPFYYGVVEALALALYCVGAWKAGWTKAPKDISFWKMLATPYEILILEQENADQQAAAAVDAANAKDADGFYYVEHGDAKPATAPALHAELSSLPPPTSQLQHPGVPETTATTVQPSGATATTNQDEEEPQPSSGVAA